MLALLVAVTVLYLVHAFTAPWSKQDWVGGIVGSLLGLAAALALV